MFETSKAPELRRQDRAGRRGEAAGGGAGEGVAVDAAAQPVLVRAAAVERDGGAHGDRRPAARHALRRDRLERAAGQQAVVERGRDRVVVRLQRAVERGTAGADIAFGRHRQDRGETHGGIEGRGEIEPAGDAAHAAPDRPGEDPFGRAHPDLDRAAGQRAGTQESRCGRGRDPVVDLAVAGEDAAEAARVGAVAQDRRAAGTVGDDLVQQADAAFDRRRRRRADDHGAVGHQCGTEVPPTLRVWPLPLTICTPVCASAGSATHASKAHARCEPRARRGAGASRDDRVQRHAGIFDTIDEDLRAGTGQPSPYGIGRYRLQRESAATPAIAPAGKTKPAHGIRARARPSPTALCVKCK